MKGLTQFSQDISNGLSNVEQGMNSLVNATKQEQARTRLVDSQKFQIRESYKADLQSFLQSLPQDMDSSSYQRQADDFTASWRSKVNESQYDQRTVGWVNSEFLPSTQESLKNRVGIAKNISMNVQTATLAGNYAKILGSDRNLPFEEATSRYESYYEETKLADLDKSLGIVDPELFSRSIMGAKALQSFQNMADKTIGSDGWDTEKAVSEVLSPFDGKLSSDEKAQVSNSAYQYAKQAGDRKNQQAKERTVVYSKGLTESIENSSYMDTSSLEAFIANTPYDYSLPARQVLAQAKEHNDKVTYALFKDYYSQKGSFVSTETLESLNNPDYAVQLMADELEDKADYAIQTGSSVSKALTQIDATDSWEEFDSSLVETAKVLAKSNLSENSTDQETRKSEEGKGISSIQSLSEWGLSLLGSDGLEETLGAMDSVLDYDKATENLSQTEDANQISVEKRLNNDDKHVFVPDGSIDKDTVTIAKNAVIQAKIAQDEQTKKIKHLSTLAHIDSLRMDRDFVINPDALKDIVYSYVKEGSITPEEAKKLSSPYDFVSSGTYSTVSATLNELVKKWGSNNAEKARIKTQLSSWLQNEYLENKGLYDDSSAAESLSLSMTQFATKSFGEKAVKGMMKVAKQLGTDSDTLLGGLRNKTTRGVLNAIANGDLDNFINNTAQTNLGYTKDGKASFEWTHYSDDDLRDYFSKQLGFSDKYEDLAENEGGNFLKYIVETNVAYAKSEAAVITAFSTAMTKFGQKPSSLEGCRSIWIGSTWAISDPEVKGLYWAPDLSNGEKPENVEWSWYSMEEGKNGMPDPRTLRPLGSISGYVPNDNDKSKRSKNKERLANAKLQEGKAPATSVEHYKNLGRVINAEKIEQSYADEETGFFEQIFKARGNLVGGGK